MTIEERVEALETELAAVRTWLAGVNQSALASIGDDVSEARARALELDAEAVTSRKQTTRMVERRLRLYSTLHQEGYRFSEIARAVGRHRLTVLHHLKKRPGGGVL